MTKILLAVMSCATLWGQATSQITGIVRDSSGLAVPAAEIKVTQTSTGLVRTTTTTAEGGYLLTNLPIGPYTLEVAKKGFNKYVQSGIVLQVDTNPTIDAVLKVGSVTEQIVVEAGAALVEAHSTAVGTVVDNQRVVELPLNGRNPIELIGISGMANSGTGAGALNPFAIIRRSRSPSRGDRVTEILTCWTARITTTS
jgi:hypothetical protein